MVAEAFETGSRDRCNAIGVDDQACDLQHSCHRRPTRSKCLVEKIEAATNLLFKVAIGTVRQLAGDVDEAAIAGAMTTLLNPRPLGSNSSGGLSRSIPVPPAERAVAGVMSHHRFGC